VFLDCGARGGVGWFRVGWLGGWWVVGVGGGGGGGGGGGVEDALDATAPWNVGEGQGLWEGGGVEGGRVVYEVEVLDWNDIIDCAAVCAGMCVSLRTCRYLYTLTEAW